jgi:hypothetical protein
VASGISAAITYPTNSTGLITVTNTNAFPVYLVANATTPVAERGNPYVIVVGQCIAAHDDISFVRFSGYLHELADTTSETTYGQQVLDVDPSPWRQTVQQAADLCAALLAKLKDPHPTLEQVEVVSDPRLQLADRVTVQEPDALQVSGDYWVIGITSRFDRTGGPTQALTLRAV